MTDPSRTRTYRWYPPAPDLEALKRLSGLDFLRRTLDGERWGPAIGSTLGFRATVFERGRAVFEGEPAEHLYNPIGTVHGGFAAAILDSAMTSAAQTTCEAGFACTTLEMKINFVRPITVATGTVTADGRVLFGGSRVATVEGRLTDRDGRLLAHGTATCLVVPL